jgi:hypothetical protein
MDENELRSAVAEVLEALPEQLDASVELSSFEAYDSIAKLSMMVCLSDFAGRPVTLEEMAGLATYGDIVKLIRSCTSDGSSS